MEDGFNCPCIDGHDRDDDTSQEERSQLVDIFDPNEDHHSHEAEADGAVHPHVVEHGTVTPMRVCGMEDGRLRDKVFLRRKNNNNERIFIDVSL